MKTSQLGFQVHMYSMIIDVESISDPKLGTTVSIELPNGSPITLIIPADAARTTTSLALLILDSLPVETLPSINSATPNKVNLVGIGTSDPSAEGISVSHGVAMTHNNTMTLGVAALSGYIIGS